MDESLGRDRLGRLVYEGDRVRLRGVDYRIHGINIREFVALEVVGGALPIGDAVIRLLEDLPHYEVDIENSPPKSNFERYFADLGLREEIDSACTHICETLPSEECLAGSCVFDRWCDDGTSFRDWLQEEATE